MKICLLLIAATFATLNNLDEVRASLEVRRARELFPSKRAYVEISQGGLQGKVSKSRKGRLFYEFLGIPYGSVPARFGESEAAQGWPGLKDSTNYGPSCIQIDENTKAISGSEDCLTLNVFTSKIPLNSSSAEFPPSKEAELMPVIFAIHHGGFSSGDVKSLLPEYIIDHDVILVTVNYRLGPFGFLNAGVPSAKGNQGLKDLVLALQWVKANIQLFSGNPDKVTLTGGSSGAYAVSYLTLSPLAKDLFTGAISESGSSLCPGTKQTKSGVALANAKKLAQALDCPSTNPSFLVKCLQRIDASVLLLPTAPLDVLLFDTSNPWFGPSLEEEGSPNAFLTQDPFEMLSSGNFNKVPYILGSNSREGEIVSEAFILSNSSLTQRLNEEWGRVAPNVFIYEDYSRDPCQISGKIRNFYFPNGTISLEDKEGLTNLFSDRWVYQCVRETALLYSQHAPVYLYNFTKQGESSILDRFGGSFRQGKSLPEQSKNNPTHLDEMQYLFPSPLFPFIHSNSTEFEFSEQLLQFWTSFASSGEPSCKKCNFTLPRSKWEPLRTGERPLKWYRLDDDLTATGWDEENPDFTKRMEFWESLNLSDTISMKKKEMEERMGEEMDSLRTVGTTDGTTIGSSSSLETTPRTGYPSVSSSTTTTAKSTTAESSTRTTVPDITTDSSSSTIITGSSTLRLITTPSTTTTPLPLPLAQKSTTSGSRAGRAFPEEIPSGNSIDTFSQPQTSKALSSSSSLQNAPYSNNSGFFNLTFHLSLLLSGFSFNNETITNTTNVSSSGPSITFDF